MKNEDFDIIDANKDNNLNSCLNYLKDYDCNFRSPLKRYWYDSHISKGLKIKLAKNGNNELVGMVQYIPIEYSVANGINMNFIQCIWIHGYKEGIGNQQGHGIGKRLLEAVILDTKVHNRDAVVAWGKDFDWLPASWYEKQGFEPIDKDDHRVLLLKKINDKDIETPSFISRKKIPQNVNRKVTLSIFKNGRCNGCNIQCEIAEKVYLDYKNDNRVEIKIFDTSKRDLLLEYGIDYGVYVDTQEVIFGPYSIEKDLRSLIDNQLGNIV